MVVAEYISRAYFKEYNFRLRVKQDTFNDQLKLRYQCVGLSDIDYNTECEFCVLNWIHCWNSGAF